MILKPRSFFRLNENSSVIPYIVKTASDGLAEVGAIEFLRNQFS